ncbi:hypothetical protein [Rhodovulum sp. P5]|uniref:hypothetical protein n=1 Tax=Rhodovulum sp. P5 TaxID=1564506 RepID=UPI0012EC9AFB|nr:hypothetical protein [Rhodovulum sp. P5]
MPFWEFLSDPDNQKTLAWVGGGVCVVVSGLWGAYLKLRKKPAAPKPQSAPTPPVQAKDGFAAGRDMTIGGNVTMSTTEIPKGVYALGALGLALLAFAILFAGGDEMTNSVKAGRDLNVGGSITINGDAAGD